MWVWVHDRDPPNAEPARLPTHTPSSTYLEAADLDGLVDVKGDIWGSELQPFLRAHEAEVVAFFHGGQPRAVQGIKAERHGVLAWGTLWYGCGMGVGMGWWVRVFCTAA